jgi:GNAT superfamily N-acetyltransferase
MDTVPQLTTGILTSATDKQSALKLVADSIAQQRQVASYYLITRPLHLSILCSLYAITYGFNKSDATLTVLTCSGLTLTYLLLIRLLTGEYITLAEDFRWKSFIRGCSDGTEDVVLATRYGQDLIGALVLRLQPSEGKAQIRAWTVVHRYRGKGVGGDLLRAAVGLAKEKCCRHVEFAKDHANSARVVNPRLGRPFAERDHRASKALSNALKELGMD